MASLIVTPRCAGAHGGGVHERVPALGLEHDDGRQRVAARGELFDPGVVEVRGGIDGTGGQQVADPPLVTPSALHLLAGAHRRRRATLLGCDSSGRPIAAHSEHVDPGGMDRSAWGCRSLLRRSPGVASPARVHRRLRRVANVRAILGSVQQRLASV